MKEGEICLTMGYFLFIFSTMTQICSFFTHIKLNFHPSTSIFLCNFVAS